MMSDKIENLTDDDFKKIMESIVMTTNTMREAFEKWYLMQRVSHASHLKQDSNGCYFGAHTETAWKAWQAAQSVPVVGEPVAWLINSPPRHVHLSKSTEVGLNGATQEPLYLAPTNSIPAAELDALRKDAERYRWLRDSPDSPIINIGYATDKMVDAAIAQGKEKK